MAFFFFLNKVILHMIKAMCLMCQGIQGLSLSHLPQYYFSVTPFYLQVKALLNHNLFPLNIIGLPEPEQV